MFLSDCAVAASLPQAGSGAPGARTIFARDVAFPLTDAYKPAGRARIPVPGYTDWPGAPTLGKRYYGLKGSGAAAAKLGKNASLKGLGDSFNYSTGFNVPAGGFPLPGGGVYEGGNPDPTIWSQVLGTIQTTLPATISAITGKNPGGYYQQGQYQQGPIFQPAPAGYYRDAQGNLIQGTAQAGAQFGAGLQNIGNSISNFVTANPLLVLGGAVGLFLLMREPPRRRNGR